MENDADDFWNPENHPWLVGKDSPADERARVDGYEDQRALIAEHVVAGGDVETAAYPDMRRHLDQVFRPTLEGIRQARVDAADLMREDLYDTEAILEDVRVTRADQEQADATVDAGSFVVPENLASARLHTTVTRLFTDPIVHNVTGESHAPKFQSGHLISLRGTLQLVGHSDINTGIELDGEYKLDLIDAGLELPGSGDPVLRLLWGPESAAVGAVHCGWLQSWAKSGGFGLPGASRQVRDRLGELATPGELALITTGAGASAWCWSGSGMSYEVFLVVDAERAPLGIILDSSPITQFVWYEDEEGGPEAKVSDWPPDAREFSVLTDSSGINPNLPDAVRSPFTTGSPGFWFPG